MRLVNVEIKNFRGFSDSVSIPIEDFTVFAGKNDVGKSSIFEAMDIFFNDKKIEASDVCVYNSDDKKIIITCQFADFPESFVIDTSHPTSLENEYLLNSKNLLEIKKVYDCSSGKGKQSVFAHANHPTVASGGDLLELTNPKLKVRAKELSINLSDVNQSVNADLRKAIWGRFSDLELQEIDIELAKETGKSLWEQIQKKLPVFALFSADRESTDQDGEAQDPMKLAVKEAIERQKDKLDDITKEVADEVKRIADETINKLNDIDTELAKSLNPKVTTKNWDSLFSIGLTGDDDIPINKRGSGVRRLILLSFFRAKAERLSEEKETNTIYAIEEPENSQHPNNQKILLDTFADLVEEKGCQILITTHSPQLARRVPKESLRHVKKIASESCTATHVDRGSEDTVQEIIDSLGILPNHDIKAFIGVEGRHDISFLKELSKILALSETDVPDLEWHESKGDIVFIPLGGSSLDLWIARLKGLNIPEFYMLDRDEEPPKEPKYHKEAEKFEKQPNCKKVWITKKREIENYLHPDVIKMEYVQYSGDGSDFEDVPRLAAKACYEASDSGKQWNDVCNDSEKLKRKESHAKKRLNREITKLMTPELLDKSDPKDEIRIFLRAIKIAIGEN